MVPSKYITNQINSPFHFLLPRVGYITNQFNKQLLVGCLAQSVKALHRFRIGQSSNPSETESFQTFFSQLHKLLI